MAWVRHHDRYETIIGHEDSAAQAPPATHRLEGKDLKPRNRRNSERHHEETCGPPRD